MSETIDGAPRWSFGPTGLAVVIALAMVGLAGAPLDRPRNAAIPGSRLLEPVGTVSGFPTQFAWTAVDGADSYEITVWPAEGAPLFRQRGRTTVLTLAFDEGAAPGPGAYRWEVVAARAGREVGRAVGVFRVAADD